MIVAPQLLATGASAAVYDHGDGTVLKIGIRPTIPLGNEADHDFLVRAFFANERRAYERLQAVPELAAYVPRYYGPEEVAADLLDPPKGKVVVAGTGLRLERLSGTEEKIGCLPPDLLDLADAALGRIKDVIGIGYPWDASAFYPGTRAPVTIIDFAHWDEQEGYLVVLKRDGTLSSQHRDFITRLLYAA